MRPVLSGVVSAGSGVSLLTSCILYFNFILSEKKAQRKGLFALALFLKKMILSRHIPNVRLAECFLTLSNDTLYLRKPYGVILISAASTTRSDLYTSRISPFNRGGDARCPDNLKEGYNVENRTFLSSRNIGLDFLRALLILEGVLYHAARSLPGGNNWYYISGKNEADGFSALIEFMHTFRMEAFFFLSGMFSAMVILRKGSSFFYSNRRKRVLVPLITAFLFIPGLMYLISAEIKGERLTTQGALGAYTYMHHLWFLVSLSLMSFFVPPRFYQGAAALMRRLPFPVLIAALIVAANAFFVVKFFVKDAGEWVSLIPVTLRFMVFYAAGYALYLNSDQIPRQARSFLVNTKVVVALGVFCWLVFYAIFHFNITSSLKYLPVLSASVFSVIFSYWVVFTFEKLRMKENRLVTGVVDSALVIYLMHYPVVITFAWMLDRRLPDTLPVTYVAVVTLLGLACSTLIYLVIKQLPLLSLLFGLKPARVQKVSAIKSRG